MNEEPEDWIPYAGYVRFPSDNPNLERHDCLFCGAYVNTECVCCGALIMSNIPGNDAFNRCGEVCYRCHLDLTGLPA